MAIRKQQAPTGSTGRAVHDSKGNSIWRFNGSESDFRDTQTWVVRALEVPGLSIDDESANPRRAGVDTDPYNRKR